MNTTFKGTINGKEFSDVKEYTDYLQKLVKDGTQNISASSSTRYGKKEALATLPYASIDQYDELYKTLKDVSLSSLINILDGAREANKDLELMREQLEDVKTTADLVSVRMSSIYDKVITTMENLEDLGADTAKLEEFKQKIVLIGAFYDDIYNEIAGIIDGSKAADSLYDTYKESVEIPAKKEDKILLEDIMKPYQCYLDELHELYKNMKDFVKYMR